VSVADAWRPFGIADEEYGNDTDSGVRVLNLKIGADKGERDRAGMWLRSAMVALAVLALAAAVVSFAAQYQLVYTLKHLVFAAVLEAGIPDVGAAVFAALGIALALHGKRALRPRALNLACVGLSVTMNALAAGHGWRDLAVWVMPSAVYAVASDTLIGVIRAWTIARHRGQDDEETTPLAVLGGLALWVLRLSLALPSTLSGFRGWVVAECPAAPQPRALTQARSAAGLAAAAAAEAREDLAEAETEVGRLEAERDELAGALQQARAQAAGQVRAAEDERDQALSAAGQAQAGIRRAERGTAQAVSAHAKASREIARLRDLLGRQRDEAAQQLTAASEYYQGRLERLAELERQQQDRTAAGTPREGTKTARFLALVEKQLGPLSALSLSDTARIAGELAPQVDLHPGSARTALANAVRTAQNGSAA
jgi:hypothetical protein